MLDGMPLTEGEKADLRICVLRNGEEIDCAEFNYVYDPTRGLIDLLDTDRNEES